MSVAFANPRSRSDNEDHSTAVEKITDNSPTPYRPPLRQSGVLFVEDPAGLGPPSPDQYWQAALDSILGVSNYGWFGPTTTQTENGPDLATMQTYALVIWDTYDCWDPSLGPAITSTDQTNIASYISGGGKVWLIGQDILWSGVPLSWMTTNFDLQSAVQDYNPAAGGNPYPVAGLAEIAGLGFSFLVDWGSDVFADGLTPTADAHHVIQDVNYPAYYPSIFSNDYQTSFWTVDGRNPNPWADWEAMVYGMLDAFGVLGIHEKPPQEPARRIHLSIAPDPIVRHATISYSIPIADNVKLQIYNKAGQLVNTLVDEYKYAGSYTVTWNARDTRDVDMPNGVYFARLTCGTMVCSKNIVVVK